MGCQIQMFIQTSQTYSKIYRTYLLWQKENVTSTMYYSSAVLSSSKCQNSYGGRVTYFIFSTYVPILITSSKCLCMTLYNIRSFGKSFGKVALRVRERAMYCYMGEKKSKHKPIIQTSKVQVHHVVSRLKSKKCL